jgi:hypothetical protein
MTRELVVAHVVNALGVGGLENGLVNLVNAPAPQVRHVVVCMTTDGAQRARLKAGVDIYAIGKAPGHDWRAIVRLVRVLRRVRPAIVHSRNWPAFDAVPAAWMAGVPVIVHGEHGRDIDDPDGRHPRRNRIRRVCAGFVTRFVTVSQDLRRWLVEEVPLETIMGAR